MGPSTLKAGTGAGAEHSASQAVLPRQTIQEAAGGHGPQGKQDAGCLLSTVTSLPGPRSYTWAPRASLRLSSGMRLLGLLPRSGALTPRQDSYWPQEQSPAPSQLSEPNHCLSSSPGSPLPPSSAPKSPGRVVNTRQPFQSSQRPTELSRQFSAFGCH